MAFYTSLFLGCLVAALVIVWILRSLSDVGQGAYGAILPSDHGHAEKRKPRAKGRSRRKARKAMRQLRGSQASTPWGWPGNGGSSSPASLSRSAQARATKPTLNRGQSALAYNTRRRAGHLDDGPNQVSKPWGW